MSIQYFYYRTIRCSMPPVAAAVGDDEGGAAAAAPGVEVGTEAGREKLAANYFR